MYIKRAQQAEKCNNVTYYCKLRTSSTSLTLAPVLCVRSVLPSLIDRLGDAKDQVRDQDQALLLKIMDQAANPQVHNSTPVH